MTTEASETWTPIGWDKGYRIIRTVYPPVDLFEDIADPADWERLASAEAKTNPRVRDAVGNLSLVPRARRLSGHTATLVMGAFTHASPLRPSRFSDGTHGVWYCGDRPEVALAETVFHFEAFMAATEEPAGDADMRELVSAIEGTLLDLRVPGPHGACLVPADYAPGQALGRRLHDEDRDGIVYPSVRWAGGEAAALLWPDRVRLPITQARHLRYHWNGRHCDRIFLHGGQGWAPWPPCETGRAGEAAPGDIP